jgi:hypothetical protein
LIIERPGCEEFRSPFEHMPATASVLVHHDFKLGVFQEVLPGFQREDVGEYEVLIIEHPQRALDRDIGRAIL